jgi:hypothetical protein
MPSDEPMERLFVHMADLLDERGVLLRLADLTAGKSKGLYSRGILRILVPGADACLCGVTYTYVELLCMPTPHTFVRKEGTTSDWYCHKI